MISSLVSAADNMSTSASSISCLEELVSFTESSSVWLQNTLTRLGWTKEKLKQKPAVSQCHIDPSHYVPTESLQHHEEMCKWRKLGYTREEIEEATAPVHVKAKPSSVMPVTIDQETQAAVLSRVTGPGLAGSHLDRPVPLTYERATVELTPAERLALYEHVVSVAKEANKLESIPVDELMLLENDKGKNKGDNLSTMEQKALERDMKRRRKSYRAKNVHITKKSHTEVIREVIENQMEILESRWKDEAREEQEEEEFRHRRERNRSRRSSSRDKFSRHHRSRKRSRDRRRGRSRSKDRRSERSYSKDRRRERSHSTDRHRDRSYSQDRHRYRSQSRDRESADREYSRPAKKHKHKHKKHKHKHREEKKGRSREDRESSQ